MDHLGKLATYKRRKMVDGFWLSNLIAFIRFYLSKAIPLQSNSIIVSAVGRFARVGSVVLALHDASDVLLEIGKMSKYSGAETLASISFILFVLSWVLLRLIYFPFWVLWSTRWVMVVPFYLLCPSWLKVGSDVAR